VLRPSRVCREVYLPAGVWYDIRSGERLVGPRHVLAEAQLDQPIPLYARGGAIIPSGPPLQWIDERPLDRLRLDVYPDAHGAAEGWLYDDDGRSLAYEHGASCRTYYHCWIDHPSGKQIVSSARTGTYTPGIRSVELQLHTDGGVHSNELPDDCGEWQIEL
jgi:alpha-glucosidase